MDTVFFTRT
ncbi:hypothetical protein D039_1438A, partial [Vibrio parahaemolyticus EKP-028]